MRRALQVLAALACMLPLAACAAPGTNAPVRPPDARVPPAQAPEESPGTSGDSGAGQESDESGMLVEPPPHESESEMTRTPPATGTENDMVQVPPPVEPQPHRPAPSAQAREVHH